MFLIEKIMKMLKIKEKKILKIKEKKYYYSYY